MGSSYTDIQLEKNGRLYTVIIDIDWIPTVLGMISVLRRITFKSMENFLFQWSVKLHFDQTGLLIKN